MRTRSFPVVPDNHSRPIGGRVERVTGVARVTFAGRAAYNSAAIAFAASTSGPGGGTKIVRR
jgi:hypothetical protein